MVEMYKRKKEKLVPRHMGPLGSADNRFCSTQPDTSLHSESADREIVAVVHQRPCLQHLAYCSVNSRHISSESRFLPTHLYSTPPLGGSRRKIAIPFGTEKLEWCGYSMVNKFRRYLYSFWHNPRTWQTHRQTERETHTDTAWRHRPRLCIASRGKKLNVVAAARTVQRRLILIIEICYGICPWPRVRFGRRWKQCNLVSLWSSCFIDSVVPA